MNELFSIRDKVIVITGGTGVLGNCMVRHLASEGAAMAVIGRNAAKGEALVGEVRKAGGRASFHTADVVDRDAVERVYEEIMAEYGRVDVLINGAGGNMPGATVPPDKTVFDLDPSDMRRVVDLNLFGTVIPTLVFARAMTARKQGSIINIASESALRPLTRVAGYGVAKAAVVNLTRSLCAEFAIKFGNGIRVNAIAPGFFLTEQNRALLTNPDGSLTARGQSVVDHTPFRRFGEPEELLGAVQWLAGDASRFVTGTVIVVDGGFDAFSI